MYSDNIVTLRSSLFGDVTQLRFVVSYQCIEINYRSQNAEYRRYTAAEA